MIQDKDTTVLYLSDRLKKNYPSFYNHFSSVLDENNVPFFLLEGTNDIWCRDYMPIQVDYDKYIQFDYHPSYLRGKYEHTISDVTKLSKQVRINPIKSHIKLDGGNVIKTSDKVIVTDKIFKENPDFSKKELIDKLEKLFEAKLYIIPALPYDALGHADGIVRFFDDNTVLVNNFTHSKESLSFQKKLYGTLGTYGFNIVQIPYYPDYKKTKTGLYSAKGVYINYLELIDKIFLPFFGNESEDMEAMEVFERLFGKRIIPINSIEIAKEGGVLNCISWNILQQVTMEKNFPVSEPNFEELKEYVFDKVPFRLFNDEFNLINDSMSIVWSSTTGKLMGDGDIKKEVCLILETLNGYRFIPQYIVDGVVDEILNYMHSIGQW